MDPPAKPNLYFNEPCLTLAVPQSLTCIPVKLALKFYHDQVVYLPADMNCGSKIEIPRSCPIIHPLSIGMTREAVEEQNRADQTLNEAMRRNGLEYYQIMEVQRHAATLDQCSNRAKPGQHSVAELRRHKRQEYPLNMHAHVQSVKAYQERDRRYMRPNVEYIPVDFGCGGPFSPECLTGWDGITLLAHRLHLWGDCATHPKPCNHECLQGWSGADLDTYRRRTWAGHNSTAFLSLDNIVYAKLARQHMKISRPRDSRLSATLNFSNIIHRHPDQWALSEDESHPPQRIERFWDPKAQEFKVVYVPDDVTLPLPWRLKQVLDQMRPVAAVETPEMAEARRRKAREVLRKKIAKDFPNGKAETAVRKGEIPSFLHAHAINRLIL